MKIITINSPIYFINVKDLPFIHLHKEEWLSTSELSLKFLEEINSAHYKVTFIKQENIFSHSMNILRKVILDTNTIAIVGIEKIFSELNVAKECKIDFKNDSIIFKDKTYNFRTFSYLRDTSEVMEYNVDTFEICYRPDYFYNDELSSIIVNGYNKFCNILPVMHISRCDHEGRIWSRGFVFPKQLFDYFNENRKTYYEILLSYLEVLEKLLSMKNINMNTDMLVRTLASHYSYSMVFSFITPNISDKLQDSIGDNALEQIYKLFVDSSPIHNKTKLIEMSIQKIRSFLINILNGVSNCENYTSIYNAVEISRSDIALMYFVTNMFSDIRRCVINIIIESNSWVESICHHRKKVNIY